MDNMLIVSCVIIGVGLLGLFIYLFSKLGRQRQIEIISEWLLLAVIKAEKELGDGTGQIKLRFVYDLFIDKFKYASMFITFSQFSDLVDKALITMRIMLSDNKQIKDYVGKQ